MPQDFSGQNLRGHSFKNQEDLTNANFSNADIRGANFANAILIGADFSNTEAGLQLHWAIVLVTASLLLSTLSGFIAAFAGIITVAALVHKDPSIVFAGVIALITLAIFFLFIIHHGLVVALGSMTVGVAAAVVATLALATVTGGNLTTTSTVAVVVAMAVTATVVAATTMTVAGTITN